MKKKKYLALFLGLSMALTAAPVGVYAKGTGTDSATPVAAQEGNGSDTDDTGGEDQGSDTNGGGDTDGGGDTNGGGDTDGGGDTTGKDSGDGATTTTAKTEDDINALLNAAKDYKYTDDTPYTYTGEVAVDGTTVTGTYPKLYQTKDTYKENIGNDLARYLGALYRADEEKHAEKITYGETEYTWDTPETLKGSNWKSGETTLVGAITANASTIMKDENLTLTIDGVDVTFKIAWKESSVTLDKSQLSMEIGDTAPLTATVYPADATLTWIVDKDGDYVQDEDGIATVTESEGSTATVKASKEGTTKVVAKIVKDDKVIASAACNVSVTKSLAQLVSEATSGATITLNRDYTLTEALVIDKNLTIIGNGYTITGDANNADVNIQLTGDAKVTIKNTKFVGFGNEASTVVGLGVIKIAENKNAELTAEKLTFADFNRAAIDARSGKITVTNCNIDCDNKATDRLTKGIVAYTDATITGGKITGANSTYEGWSASGIETCAGANVTVKNVAIESMKGGISVARNYGSAGTEENTSDAEVTVENCTITASDYALRVYQGSQGLPAKEHTTATLTVNGGQYKGDVRIGVGSGVAEDENNHIIINSGYFTVDPATFVADGKVSAQSTLSGYNFMVVDKKDGQTVVKPATGTTEVTVPGTIASEVKTAVEDTAKSVKAEDSVLLDQAKTTAASTTVAAATEALKDAGITPAEGTTVTVYKQAYLDVVVKSVTNTSVTVNTLTLEIKPMVKEIASTATTAAGIVTGDNGTRNAVQLGDAKALTINTPSEITVTTPFKSTTVYIKHVKADGKTYSYKGDTNANGELTFISKYGFSEFTLSTTKDESIVAETGGVGYTSLQDAVNAVENGGTITIVENGTYSATASASKSFSIVADQGVNASWELKIIKKSSGSSSSGSSSSGGSSGGGGSSSTKTDTDKKVEEVKQDETKDEAKGDEIAKKMTILLQIGSKVAIVDGTAKTGDVAPVIRNSRTLVPIRMITEALGGQVAWNAETKAVTLTIDGKEIPMVIGQTLAKYGVAPEIIGDRTFVPVRFVTDELGATIAWNDATKGITITK